MNDMSAGSIAIQEEIVRASHFVNMEWTNSELGLLQTSVLRSTPQCKLAAISKLIFYLEIYAMMLVN